MWQSHRKLSTYHKVVRAIAGIMALSVLMFQAPSRDP
jgi:hypothetical protein